MSNQTIDRIRVLMAPGNPLPNTDESGATGTVTGLPGADTTLDWIMSQPSNGVEQARQPRTRGRPPRLNRPARRVVAPLGAGLAVAGLIIGLTFAAQSPQSQIRRPGAGAPTGGTPATPMPAFFVQYGINPRGGVLYAAVRDSTTGHLLSQITIPGWAGTVPTIAADGSDRTFLLTTMLGGHPQITGGTIARTGRSGVIALFRLQVAPDGRSEKLTRLPMNLLPARSNDVVEGIAVAPGGSKLAVALDIGPADPNSFNTRGEIALYSLTGGRTRTWTAPADVRALPFDPLWTSTTTLSFVWQDKLRGSMEYFLTGRSQIRVLDTSAPGHSLLASSVLLSGGGRLGFIQSGGVGPGGSPIDVATFRVTSIGGRGDATMLLAQVSPSGTVTKTFATYTRAYNGFEQEGAVSSVCQVLATDATGQHTLAICPNFGRIDNGTFTPLAHNFVDSTAAW
jgi:hypothetical protein